MLVGILDDGKLSILAAATNPATLGGQTSRGETQDMDRLGFACVGSESCDVVVLGAGREVESAVALGADQGAQLPMPVSGELVILKLAKLAVGH